MVTGIGIARSAAGHRRKERDLARAGDRSILLDMGVVDRGADYPRRLEGIGVAFAAAGKPADQVFDGAHIRRRLERLLGLADAFAHPGKILHPHPSSSLMR